MSVWIQNRQREKVNLMDASEIDVFYCPYCSEEIRWLDQAYLQTVWEYCAVDLATGEEDDWESGDCVESDPQAPTCPICSHEVSRDEVIEHSKEVYLTMMESMESDLDDEP